MIELHNVHKSYGTFEAVRGVSMAAHHGEILGLLGPNGAGKTTIMKILTTYHLPTSGSAVVGNLDVYRDAEEIRSIVGYLPEQTPLYEDATVTEYLGFIMDARNIERGQRPARLDFAVESCGLADVANQNIGTLSKGYRQRVGLAQAIIHDPSILILDEPTTGLDPNQIQEIRRLVRHLGKEKTVILSTHILQEVEAMCDRVVIIHRGEIAAAGTTAEIEATLKGDAEIAVEYRGSGKTSSLAALPEIRSLELVSSEEPDISRILVRTDSETEAPEKIFQWAVSEGVVLRELHKRSRSLEQVFSHLTRGNTSGEDPTLGEGLQKDSSTEREG